MKWLCCLGAAADTHTKDSDKNIPVQFACLQGHPEETQWLSNRSIEPHHGDHLSTYQCRDDDDDDIDDDKMTMTTTMMMMMMVRHDAIGCILFLVARGTMWRLSSSGCAIAGASSGDSNHSVCNSYPCGLADREKGCPFYVLSLSPSSTSLLSLSSTGSSWEVEMSRKNAMVVLTKHPSRLSQQQKQQPRLQEWQHREKIQSKHYQQRV